MTPISAPLLVLLLGAPLLGIDAGLRPPRYAWDIPDIVSTVEVPGVQMADGIPVRFHAVVTKWKLDDIARHITRSFAAAKLYIPPPQHQLDVGERVAQLTALDWESGTSYTAILQPNPDGSTTVIMGQAYLSQKAAPPPDFAPIFPGATGVVRTNVESMRAITYAAKASEKDVFDFYRAVMGKAGYQEESPGAFRRGSELIAVQAKSGEKKGELSVLVTSRAAPPQ
ncbi:MAG: hypothetical protein HYZ28_20355 [Myxococcales bacterium]|nr:hypothetical protein [Myxococcales bacterium]